MTLPGQSNRAPPPPQSATHRPPGHRRSIGGVGTALRERRRDVSVVWQTPYDDATLAQFLDQNAYAGTIDLPAAATPPRLTGNPAAYFGPDSYPNEALRHNWEGRSRVALLVDDSGVPTACEVVESSGHAVLDRTTCHMAVDHVRFEPARNRKGRPIAGIYRTFNVRWQMPK